MRNPIALMVIALLMSGTGAASARVNSADPGMLHMTRAPEKVAGRADNQWVGLKDIPSDTLDFGFYTPRLNGWKYAVLGEKWTWDHGAPDSREGWETVDMTAQLGTFFRHMTGAKWLAEQNLPPWPAISGDGFALCGARHGFADSLGWAAGAGFGNYWCQRLISPTFRYDGSGMVHLGFKYFSQGELDWGRTSVFVEVGTGRVPLNYPEFSGVIGIDPATGMITPETWEHDITNGDFGGDTHERNFTIVIEFQSFWGKSDEDGAVDTWYGPFGMDDFNIGADNLVPASTRTFDFEADLQGWTPEVCLGVGSYFGIADVSVYNIWDTCGDCGVQGHVVNFHDGWMVHPDGQHEMIVSPIIDRKTDIDALKGQDAYLKYNRVFADYDMVTALPANEGVLYRVGWTYYPYPNPQMPGMDMWSPRVGTECYYYSGDGLSCGAGRNIATDWGLPTDTQQLKLIFEVWADCIWGRPCTGNSNFTPLIDNVRVRNVGRKAAPVVLFSIGGKYQDGFGQSELGILDTEDCGNSDVVYNVRHGTSAPAILGDSLVVMGPVPVPGVASTRWEAKLWFRLNRVGPGQGAGWNWTYYLWHNRVAAAKGEFVGANANFAWGYMDSVETGTSVKSASSYRFCSQFRDGPSAGGFMLPADPNYSWGGWGEFESGNAILPDRCFAPGTKVQYFITSNYVPTPNVLEYYPDTTGKNYYEFEILPSFRTVDGVDKFPCMLYVDACDYDEEWEIPSAQYVIERALNVKMNGLPASSPIPDPTGWDRYDYGDAPSNWQASIYRQTGGNAGATITQMLGYRLIMVNTGGLDTGSMMDRDWQGFGQWLEGPLCDANSVRQGFIANGNSISAIIGTTYPSFLTKNLGATHTCLSYHQAGCPVYEYENDYNYCVRLGQMPGYFETAIPTDLFGNWCPDMWPFGVLGSNPAVVTAAGNKYYQKIGSPGVETDYAQVINDQLPAAEKYRTVIDNFSYHLLIQPNPAAAPPLSANDCRYPTPQDATTARIGAAAKELENAIKWTMGGIPGLCINPCDNLSDVSDRDGVPTAVNRLYENRPNPFNPRTAIRFSLAADGPAKLIIYDVGGRQIRTLVSGPQKAGAHEAVWDGTDDSGHVVTSGVYWSRLTAGAYSSNRKMVVLK